MSFNAREALQRIRQAKISKDESQSLQDQPSYNTPLYQDFTDDFQSVRKQNFNGVVESQIHLDEFNALNASEFVSYDSQAGKQDRTIMSQLMKKVAHLERTTDKLAKQLSRSQQISTLMRGEKSALQTQILRLENENKLLKSEQKKRTATRPPMSDHKINSQSKLESAQKGSKNSGDSLPQPSIDNDSIQLIQKCTYVSQQLLSPIINEPISSILSKKQKNFRVLKVSPRLHGCNKELLKLAQILREYPNMERPTIEIDISNLTEADFQRY